MQNQSIQPLKINRHFYAGLPSLLANRAALANLDQISRHDLDYLQSCAESALISLGGLLTTAARLLNTNLNPDSADALTPAETADFILNLNTNIGGLMAVVAGIGGDLAASESLSRPRPPAIKQPRQPAPAIAA